MADVRPFRGIVYNPEHIQLGGVLAPPYDVISDARREALYASNLRNIVRIDYGAPFDDDVAGVNDRYTRAAAHLESWRGLGILTLATKPAYVVTAHEFVMPDGSPRRRLGIFATVAARPWDTSDLRPHERTLRGPKVDRLALMRATRTQTSAVFAMWDEAPALVDVLTEVTVAPAFLGGRTEGEFDSEKHLVWVVDDERHVAAIAAALAHSHLYVADGHHRYETAVAYAVERRAQAGADADGAFAQCLVYLAGADDPGMTILPTHRLIRPRAGLPETVAELSSSVPAGVDVVEVDDLDAAARAAGLRRATHHAYGIAMRQGTALLVRKRDVTPATPRAGLDVAVLEEILLVPLGIDAVAVTEGALAYSRSVCDVAAHVASGEAGLGVTVNAATVAEVIAVADAEEVMPQKSTYFYPKVPTGIVLAPL